MLQQAHRFLYKTQALNNFKTSTTVTTLFVQPATTRVLRCVTINTATPSDRLSAPLEITATLLDHAVVQTSPAYTRHLTTTLLSELEHMCGAPVILQIELFSKTFMNRKYVALKNIFQRVFKNCYSSFFVSTKVFYYLTILFFRTGDVDFYLTEVSTAFSKNHYSAFRRVFAAWCNILQYVWFAVVKDFGAVGLYVSLDGKLGKLLLTRGQTVRLRLGVTAKSTVNNNVIFRYTTVSSDSGVFGIAIYYYTRNFKNNLCLKMIDVD